MDTSIIDIIYKVLDSIFDLFKYMLPAISALLAVVITQGFFILNDKNKKKWEKQKSHRDFQLEIIKARKEQTEEFIKKYSTYIIEYISMLVNTRFVNNQEDLDRFYLDIEKDSQDEDPDPERLAFTYLSPVRTFKDQNLNGLLDQIVDIGATVIDLWAELYPNKPNIDYVLSRKAHYIDKGFDYRDKYQALVTQLLLRLDDLYRESDPFINY